MRHNAKRQRTLSLQLIGYFTVVYSGLHCFKWFTLVYNVLHWFTVVYNGLYWFTMVYSGLNFFILFYSG